MISITVKITWHFKVDTTLELIEIGTGGGYKIIREYINFMKL
jgi:hypothetical protein